MGSKRTLRIKVPDLGEGIAEVELVAWRVAPGDAVAEDQVLADVMTDKATVEIPSPVAGRVLALGGEPGRTMAVGAELIRIEVEAPGGAAVAPGGAAAAPPAAAPTPDAGSSPQAAQGAQGAEGATAPVSATAPTPASAPSREAPPALVLKAAPAPASAPEAPASPTAPGVASPASSAPVAEAPSRDRPIASPAVRRRAWELGIDLGEVVPGGTAGRIVQADLDAHAARTAGRQDRPPPAATARPPAGAPDPAGRSGEEAIPVIGLRRRIAERMQDAQRRVAHFTYVEEVDVTELEALRARLNAPEAGGGQRPHLTLLPFLVRALVLAVRRFPQVNARYDDAAGVLTRHAAVHLGVATQTDAGLLVPVLRHAEARDLWACAAEIARLAAAARAGRATRGELGGSTLTLTSLGAAGGVASTPIVNLPEVAIVGVNRIVRRPVMRGDAVVGRQMMNLSSSFDHRVIDGADAAGFVQALRASLECPALLFVP